MRGDCARVGYLARSFDLINVRDLDLIAQARQQCARLVVGIHSDALVEQLTGRPPVVPFADRLALVAHVRGVDEVRVHEAGAEPADAVVFVDDRTPFAAGGGPLPSRIVALDAARQTESTALRLALAPLGEAVA
ncbi:MAG TPA: cytidyltransferase [Microlunatus sp.]|nr:cytidyltransferase [Microlunatus sp.]